MFHLLLNIPPIFRNHKLCFSIVGNNMKLTQWAHGSYVTLITAPVTPRCLGITTHFFPEFIPNFFSSVPALSQSPGFVCCWLTGQSSNLFAIGFYLSDHKTYLIIYL